MIPIVDGDDGNAAAPDDAEVKAWAPTQSRAAWRINLEVPLSSPGEDFMQIEAFQEKLKENKTYVGETPAEVLHNPSTASHFPWQRHSKIFGM
jgi:hypothetical protein